MKNRGFTFLEIITLLAILSIITIFASPRLFSPPAVRAYYAVRKMGSDVRYAQLLAIERQARTRVVFNAATDVYQVERETTPNTWVLATHPSTRTNYVVNFNVKDYTGVDVTTVSLNGGSSVIFDSYGRPFRSTGAALTEPAYVDLNGGAYRLNFRAETGKVDIS